MEGNLMRLLHTPTLAMHPTPSTRRLVSDPLFAFGAPLQMYVSCVALKAPPSPLRKLRTARSAIVRWNGTVVVRLAFVARIDRSYVPDGDAGLVFTRKVDVKRAGPLPGEKLHMTSEGHPETLKDTGLAEVP